MTTFISSLLAVVLYPLASFNLLRWLRGRGRRRPALLIAGAALVAHGIGSLSGIITPLGMNLSLLQTSSLIAWFICLITLLNSLRRPLENLLVVILPIAAAMIVLTLVLDQPQQYRPHDAGMISHILLSILAYSILSIAAVQAIALAVQEYRLKHHQLTGILRVLPPLQTMERMLFELIAIGFVLLTLAIGTGLLYVEDLFAQHLVHKTVFSLAAWLVFAVLLWGRYQLGWRSKTAIQGTLSGFAFLLLAYIGTRIVLEWILHH